MKIFTFLGILCGTLLGLQQTAHAQNGWPKTTTAANGSVIKLYEWQPESFSDNKLKARAAISVTESGKGDPVFGVAWLDATTVTNGNQVQVQSIYITDIKLPGEYKDEDLETIAVALEKQAPGWNLAFSQSELQASMELSQKENDLAKQINNAPPKVIYASTPSILVLIDGEPRFQQNPDWGVEAVVNTPFAIVKNNDGRYYLYGGKHWYTATSVKGNYTLTTNVPSNLQKVAQAVNEANKENEAQEKDANTIYNIIVSTEPAELIQTKGEPNFAAVNGTGLLYVSNSDDDIFMDINEQQYYVLISGRWYRSKTLSGNWQYIAADKLPADFAKIPAGSPKDNVLASVAGTVQAEDAVKEAQVPQTAKVDRNKANADIVYDGDPRFELIDGTDLYYAINTPASVIRWRGRYYAVNDGIWFESNYATGPWVVAVVRPHVVSLIPPRYPVYYMKYVYIYDYTPDYVWVGYTPGYLNTYIYGPTVVYGTGYYYRPWYGRYYYPRPCTWGYGVRYNPWFGWGLHVGFSTGWFHVSFGVGSYRPWTYWGWGGWWGPRVYRPPFCYSPYTYGGGWYAVNRTRNVNINITNINYTNNIYNVRRDVVVTRDNQRHVRPANTYNGRGNFASNNRFDNNNRFNRNGINRNSSDVRGGSPSGVRGENGRPSRQFERNGNNSDRVGNMNGGFRRNSEGNNQQPSRQWRNNGNNNQTDGMGRPGLGRRQEQLQNGNTNNQPGSNEGRTPRQFGQNSDRNEARPARQFGQQNNNGSPERVRRQFGQQDNNGTERARRQLAQEGTVRQPGQQNNGNNNGVPRQFERQNNNSGNRPQVERPQNNGQPSTIRRAPQREYQAPATRQPERRVERPEVRRNENVGANRQPQVQRSGSSRPPVRESVRRDDAPRNSGGVQRGGGGGGNRPSRSEGGRGGRGN